MLHFEIVAVNDGIFEKRIAPGSDQIQGSGSAINTRRTVSPVFHVPAYVVVIELEIAIPGKGMQPGKLFKIGADLLIAQSGKKPIGSPPRVQISKLPRGIAITEPNVKAVTAGWVINKASAAALKLPSLTAKKNVLNWLRFIFKLKLSKT